MTRGVSVFAALLVALGAVARLRAAALGDFEMFRSFPTEDGYLMLTVARNVALGRGLSSAAGTIPTNGVQPLAALLQAACFRVVGADRAAGVRLLIVVYTAIAAATAVLIHLLGRTVFAGTSAAPGAAPLAAAAWFASPVTVFPGMNMLETGLYAALVVLVALSFARGHASPAPWPWTRSLAVGALLGAAFWARNDAVFLMAGIGLVHLSSARRGPGPRRRLGEVAIMAAAAGAISLPWLLHNLFGFGSLMPLSAFAHLRAGDVAANLRAAVMALFEQLTLVASFEFGATPGGAGLTALSAAIVAAAAVVIVIRLRRAEPATIAVAGVGALFGLGLIVFYVFFFDAPYFIRRYLFPLSPLLALAWGAAAAAVVRRLGSPALRVAGGVAAGLLLANFVVRDALLIRGPWRSGALFRNVDWVESHLSADTWVGAFQSGTLGFFHDRTLNLDGKVNPEALRAIRERRHQAYVVGSPIGVLVDWVTILEPWWQSDPSLKRQFEWLVQDRPGNFAVLARRSGAAP